MQRKSRDIAAAEAALHAMGFECMSDDGEPLREYWLPYPPFTKVVLHDHEWQERTWIISNLARHINIDEFIRRVRW